MSNNSYLENWIETFNTTENNSSFIKTSQYSTNDWIYLGFNIIGVVIVLAPPIGYAFYKFRCFGTIPMQESECLGNDKTGDDSGINL